MKNKVVLIAPSPYSVDVHAVSDHFVETPSIPPALVSLGSFLNRHNVRVELIDAQMDFGFGTTAAAEQAVQAKIASHLQSEEHDTLWTGILCDGQPASVSSPRARNGLALGKAIKSSSLSMPLLYIGYFPSVYYRELLKDYDYVDGVIFGNAEGPSLEISRALLQGMRFADLRVAGLIQRATLMKDSSGFYRGHDESVPALDLGLLNNPSKYPLAAFMTSRGCPFPCSFCAEPSIRQYQPQSLEFLTEQFKHFERFLECTRSHVYDPTFGIGRTRTTRLIDLFRATSFEFLLASRVDTLAPDLIGDLGNAGVKCISLGLESASLSSLLRMGKIKDRNHYARYMDGARRIVAECFLHNITVSIGIMLGYPGDSIQDTQHTLDFLDSISLLHEDNRRKTGREPGFMVFPNFVRIYPGTPLYRARHVYDSTKLEEDELLKDFVVAGPSPGYDYTLLNSHYCQVQRAGIVTHLSEKRRTQFIGFHLEGVLQEAPQILKDEIVIWRDHIRGILDPVH